MSKNNLFSQDLESEKIQALSQVDESAIISTDIALKSDEEKNETSKETKKTKKPKEEKVEVTSKTLEDLIKAITSSVSKPVSADTYTEDQKKEDKKYMQLYTGKQLEMYKEAPKVAITVPGHLANIIGSTYTFLFNGIPVSLMCDNQEHLYPDYVADEILRKLTSISEHNTPKVVNNKAESL